MAATSSRMRWLASGCWLRFTHETVGTCNGLAQHAARPEEAHSGKKKPAIDPAMSLELQRETRDESETCMNHT